MATSYSPAHSSNRPPQKTRQQSHPQPPHRRWQATPPGEMGGALRAGLTADGVLGGTGPVGMHRNINVYLTQANTYTQFLELLHQYHVFPIQALICSLTVPLQALIYPLTVPLQALICPLTVPHTGPDLSPDCAPTGPDLSPDCAPYRP